MEIIVFEEKTYYKLLAEMQRMISEAMTEGKKSVKPAEEKPEDWISPEEAQSILKCKIDKLRALRDKDEIRASKTGRSVLYYAPSLYEYLFRHTNRQPLR